jgi:ATP-binding cassette, subfamily C (CFTR/MRP), member 1
MHSNHALFRFITMFRGAIISLIYGKSLHLHQAEIENAAAISLMSNDVDSIAYCFEELNELWSRFIELLVGIPLLATQLGWVCIMPLIIVLSELTA